MKVLMHKNEFLCVMAYGLFLTFPACLQTPYGFSSLSDAILLAVVRQFC
jgi:hypothetical protein